jgi:hypothetical protein
LCCCDPHIQDEHITLIGARGVTPVVCQFSSELGVPVAGGQKTTIRTFTGHREGKNEGLRPHIRWTKTLDFVYVYRGISPMNRVFFPTSAVCPVHPTQAMGVFQRGQ